MPLFEIRLKAALEGAASVAMGPEYALRVKFACGACREPSDKFSVFSWEDEVEVQGGKGTAQLVQVSRGGAGGWGAGRDEDERWRQRASRNGGGGWRLPCCCCCCCSPQLAPCPPIPPTLTQACKNCKAPCSVSIASTRADGVYTAASAEAGKAAAVATIECRGAVPVAAQPGPGWTVAGPSGATWDDVSLDDEFAEFDEGADASVTVLDAVMEVGPAGGGKQR